jgi:hypothetical protein
VPVSRQGLFIIEPEQRHRRQNQQQPLSISHLLLIDARICRLHYPVPALLCCVCTSGDVGAVYPGFCRLADSHNHQAASCCPSSVPLTAAVTRAPSCSVYANIAARASNARHTTASPAVRALLFTRQHAVPSSARAESLAFAVTSRPRPAAAYPLLAQLHLQLNIATPHHAAIHPPQQKPPTGELRRSSARSPCRIRACRTTRIRRACATESPSPRRSKHQSQRQLSAT